MIVTATKDADGKYPYNTVTVVLLIEVVKLLVSLLLNLREFATDLC